MDTLDFMRGMYFVPQMRIQLISNIGTKLSNDIKNNKISADEAQTIQAAYLNAYEQSLMTLVRDKDGLERASEKWEMQLYDQFEDIFLKTAHLENDKENGPVMAAALKNAWAVGKYNAMRND